MAEWVGAGLDRPPTPARQTPMTMLRIAGGTVYDPANGVDGVVRDICIDAGKIVEQVPPDAPRLDASGMVVMPGAIDIHAHIAASSVNAARRLLPEQHDADPVAAPRLYSSLKSEVESARASKCSMI